MVTPREVQSERSERTELSVGELLGILDGGGLHLASGRPEILLPRTSPTLYDPWAPSSGRRSGVLLGIGLHPTEAKTLEVVRESARHGFGAIVIKSLSLSLSSIAALADAEGIALLVADDELDWRQLDALISSALRSAPDSNTELSGLAIGDLFALANAIAALVGGATSIEDLQERVLAYSTVPDQPIDEDRRVGILGRQVPFLPENAEQYAAVFRAPGALWVSGVRPALDRVAVAIRAGAQPLGSIWVVDATGDIDADALGALERAADIAALHLLRARNAADLARQQRGALLRRLLEGGEDSKLIVEQLGLDTAGSFIAVGFQPQFAAGGDEPRMGRLIDLIAMQCEAHQHGTECVVLGNTVYSLFTGAAAADVAGIQSMAERLVARAASALRLEVRAALGSTVATVGEISRSRHDADLVLLLLANHQTVVSVASAHEARSRLTLLELSQVFRDTPRLLSPHASAVLDCDSRTGSDYAGTLRTYLDSARDSAVTASRLSVHQNTLRYRLRRAEELFGIDLGNPDDTMTLWLSLRVVEFN
ncbi:PucR family transcriptional regulator [Glaciibacter psychrotolerans]|uniref:DNA-binding PucR family transcriptional regulator n=1 Tax=Glaciibacter psychrotolerans TaxID=670054 RepID=A0A7Z0EDQ8_9MICO|nr:PucR family transcriptional regulator [Leifsonia psychrotolerans]NYJ19740.1 DNA-binding PucR family transcriptional regulator [Leifsonia psychrotolerans]